MSRVSNETLESVLWNAHYVQIKLMSLTVHILKRHEQAKELRFTVFFRYNTVQISLKSMLKHLIYLICPVVH